MYAWASVVPQVPLALGYASTPTGAFSDFLNVEESNLFDPNEIKFIPYTCVKTVTA